MTISLLFMAINFCHAQRVMSAEDVIRSSGGRISFFEGIYRRIRLKARFNSSINKVRFKMSLAHSFILQVIFKYYLCKKN